MDKFQQIIDESSGAQAGRETELAPAPAAVQEVLSTGSMPASPQLFDVFQHATGLFERLEPSSQRNLMLISKQMLKDLRPRITGVRARKLAGVQLLPNLKQLSVINCWSFGAIGTLLHKLPALSTVFLRYTDPPVHIPEVSLQPLAGMTGLQHLEIRIKMPKAFSGVILLRNYTPLATLTRLQSLVLHGPRDLAYATALTTLTLLQRLSLSSTTFRDTASLARLPNLQDLRLTSSQALRLDPLTLLTRLGSLALRLKQDSPPKPLPPAADLRPVSLLTTLTSLTLSGFREADLRRPVGHLTGLHYLDLRESEIQDLAFLEALTALRVLRLLGWNYDLQDLRPLSALAALECLELPRCDILRDLGPLTALRNLAALNVAAADLRQAQRRRLLLQLPALQAVAFPPDNGYQPNKCSIMAALAGRGFVCTLRNSGETDPNHAHYWDCRLGAAGERWQLQELRVRP